MRIVASLAVLSVALPAQAWGPGTNYAIHCQGCHLADGDGTPGKVPRLAGQVAFFLRSPEGRAYLGRVPGVANAPLPDAELAALLNWTLHRFDAAHIPPDFVPYTAAEIGALRGAPLVEVTHERIRLLEVAR
jgi:hypothetical protein